MWPSRREGSMDASLLASFRRLAHARASVATLPRRRADAASDEGGGMMGGEERAAADTVHEGDWSAQEIQSSTTDEGMVRVPPARWPSTCANGMSRDL